MNPLSAHTAPAMEPLSALVISPLGGDKAHRLFVLRPQTVRNDVLTMSTSGGISYIIVRKGGFREESKLALSADDYG